MSCDCGSSWIKFCLIAVNLALAVVGLYLLLVDNVFHVVYIDNYVDSDEHLIENLCTACIVIGSCIFVMSVIGIIASAIGNKCLLGTYIGIDLILIAANITIIFFAVRYKTKIIEKFDTSFEKKLVSQNYTGSLAKTMDILQVELKCCGIDSPSNYENTRLHNNHTGQNVPLSCCRLVNNKEHDDFNITTSDVISANGCQHEYSQLKNSKHTFKYLNNQGCFLKFEQFIWSKAFVLGGIGVGIIALEILGFIFSVYLCNTNTRVYSTVDHLIPNKN